MAVISSKVLLKFYFHFKQIFFISVLNLIITAAVAYIACLIQWSACASIGAILWLTRICIDLTKRPPEPILTSAIHIATGIHAACCIILARRRQAFVYSCLTKRSSELWTAVAKKICCIQRYTSGVFLARIWKANTLILAIGSTVTGY